MVSEHRVRHDALYEMTGDDDWARRWSRYAAFGRLISMTRRRYGWSMAHLADRAGVELTVVVLQETHSRYAPTSEDARRLLVALDLPVACMKVLQDDSRKTYTAVLKFLARLDVAPLSEYEQYELNKLMGQL